MQDLRERLAIDVRTADRRNGIEMPAEFIQLKNEQEAVSCFYYFPRAMRLVAREDELDGDGERERKKGSAADRMKLNGAKKCWLM